MDTIMFHEAVPQLNRTEDYPVLYCPINYNYPGVDGIIVQFTGQKCFVYPLQITVAKSHSDSEEAFFRQWGMWTNSLEDFEVVPVFVWITKEDSGVVEVDTIKAEYRSTKSGDLLVHPSYDRLNVPLKEVNLVIWERYQRALRTIEKSKSLVENECLRDNQAPLDASENRERLEGRWRKEG
jgi:hypothetical protein